MTVDIRQNKTGELIVAHDSDPADFSLVETVLWEPCCGFWLLPEHLQRLHKSAHYFSVAYDEDALIRQLDVIANGLTQQPHVLRVLINLHGNINLSAEPANIDNSPVQATLAKHAIDPTNIYLYHSTTIRHVYDQAMVDGQEVDEVILWNNRGEVTESCTSNLLVEIDGQYYTPPVVSGLLPGTCRARLLAEGRLSERTIIVDELPLCSRIYLINAIVGWREVRLIA